MRGRKNRGKSFDAYTNKNEAYPKWRFTPKISGNFSSA